MKKIVLAGLLFAFVAASPAFAQNENVYFALRGGASNITVFDEGAIELDDTVFMLAPAVGYKLPDYNARLELEYAYRAKGEQSFSNGVDSITFEWTNHTFSLQGTMISLSTSRLCHLSILGLV